MRNLMDLNRTSWDKNFGFRFGLDGADPMTLEDIGTLLQITRERVRQIKEKALLKLRHNSRRRSLESFLG